MGGDEHAQEAGSGILGVVVLFYGKNVASQWRTMVIGEGISLLPMTPSVDVPGRRAVPWLSLPFLGEGNRV